MNLHELFTENSTISWLFRKRDSVWMLGLAAKGHIRQR
jgi:hypothetical protein